MGGVSAAMLVVIVHNLKHRQRARLQSSLLAVTNQSMCSGGLKTLIISGDYHHTALAVARQAGMVQPQTEIVIIDTYKQAGVRTELSSLNRAIEEPSTCVDILTASPELSRETSLPDADRDLARLASTLPSLSTRTSNLVSLRARLVNLTRTSDEQATITGLRFVLGENNQELEQSQAVTALAEGHAQCAVTGAAFELLLHQQDLSLLDVAMRNAIVFARMAPHQKGQVMDLITMRGIHQMTARGSRFIPVSGILLYSCSHFHVGSVLCMMPTTNKCSQAKLAQTKNA